VNLRARIPVGHSCSYDRLDQIKSVLSAVPVQVFDELSESAFLGAGYWVLGPMDLLASPSGNSPYTSICRVVVSGQTLRGKCSFVVFHLGPRTSLALEVNLLVLRLSPDTKNKLQGPATST
jgi:hypothetical protein